MKMNSKILPAIVAPLVALLVFGQPFPAAAITNATPSTSTGNTMVVPAKPNIAAAPAVGTRSAPGAADTEDIRDIRPPYHISPGWMWLVWLGAGAALAALAYGLWRWRHRLPGMRVKLPFELALEQLEAARNLMQPERAREFSIRVSEVVRNYVEVRFATRAAHRTTGEFLHDCVAASDSPLAEHRPLLGDFLYHCDLAKFARWVLSVSEMEAMLQSGTTFVRETGLAAEVSGPESPAHSGRASSPRRPPTKAQPDAPATEAGVDRDVSQANLQKSERLDALPS